MIDDLTKYGLVCLEALHVSDLSRTDSAVLLALASKNRPYATAAMLGEDIGRSRQSVDYAVERLATEGYILPGTPIYITLRGRVEITGRLLDYDFMVRFENMTRLMRE